MKRIKTLLAVLVAAVSVNVASAQMFQLGVQVTPSLPLGDFSSEEGYNASFGLGGKLMGNYFLNENFHLGLEVGFLSYGIKDMEVEYVNPMTGETVKETIEIDENYTLMPVQVAAAYHLDAEDEFDVYFGTGVGMFIFGNTMEGSESMTLFGFTPRVGVSYELSDALRFNGNLEFGYVMGKTEEEDLGGGVTMEIEYPDLTMLNFNLGVTYTLWD